MQSKSEIRAIAKNARDELVSKDKLSERIQNNLLEIPQFRDAKQIAFYVDVRSEARTRSLLTYELNQRNRVISVPFCDGTDLQLVRIELFSELRAGKFGILEPNDVLRAESARAVDVNEVDCILVPGVSFDRIGNRIGYGAGYYDRLLANAHRPIKIGLAFSCQLVDAIPADRFDVRVDFVCTEYGCVDCREQ